MTSAPIQADLILCDALRVRRRRTEPLRGLDTVAYRWLRRMRHARVGMRYLRCEAEAVDAMGGYWAGLSDAALDQKILTLRESFARYSATNTDVRHALAAIREVADRQTGHRPYLVQIMGALGLHYGQIIELVTGEGKTLVAAVAATLLAWRRRPVHVITINDYLAERDADLGQPLFKRCGLTAAAVVGETPAAQRAQRYRQPIVYSTQKDLVADWLRDQLRLGAIADPVSTRWRLSQTMGRHRHAQPPTVMVPGLHVAIIDEIDAVLIDEAVTPLIIAQPRGEHAQAALYERARDLAGRLRPGAHFTTDKLRRRAKLTSAGQDRVESMIGEAANPSRDEHAIWNAIHRREELVEQALSAAHCYHHGQNFQIVEDRIIIVDEYTGRFEHDRQWQHGLHQAVEAKHHLPITADRNTLASLSFQRYFMQYAHLCGLTGTAVDAKAEMETTYGLPVRVIPTHRPVRRVRHPNLIFANAQHKWNAVVDQVQKAHEQERPLLISTRSIDASERLSSMLEACGLKHQVLNAVHHEAEAQIVAQAGAPGAITVATNMAGRGTDIRLGPGVAKRGGLHVILTEFHTARRIDRQLIGRSGRQGDPGSAQAIVCLEDELLLKYTPGLAAALRGRFAGRTTPLPRWTQLVFTMAQKRATRLAFHARTAVLRHEQDLDRALPR